MLKPEKRQSEQNVAVLWLALLLHIRAVPGSNLGPETGYPDRFFAVFPSLQADAAIVP
jgi:hypothetical protein